MFLTPGTMAQGRDGNIYTTSVVGGTSNYGTVFRMTPAGVLSVPLMFSYANGGANPYSGLTLSRDGNFYGGVGFVYDNVGCNGLGSIFRVTPAGALTYLYTYPTTGAAGYPMQVPIQGGDGNYYGTTAGSYDFCGILTNATIYKITPSGVLTTLFQGTPGDYLVLAFQGTDGSFYGFTQRDSGSIFKISSAGKFTTIYQFDGTHGAQPVGLIQGGDGNFYGTTNQGGTGAGVIFKLTPTGHITVLHNFSDAKSPVSGVVQANDGTLYGVTPVGGVVDYRQLNYGAIYSIKTDGTNYSVLYSFDGTSASTPEVSLMQHTNGSFYGLSYSGGLTCWYSTTCGTFYTFNAGLPPFVNLMSTSGKVGASVQILGQGFTSATRVWFGPAAATPRTVSNTYLVVSVPNGAATGNVMVANTGENLSSSKVFRVIPSISGFLPTSAGIGTNVTISGMSLAQSSKITFGGVAAPNFTIVSDTQINAVVPANAKTGRIGVVTLGGSAVSPSIFTVTQ